jgi:predicted ABC-type transport system involved in lysophospholipase L1 biosynthesis ATPase subunit
MTSYPHLWSLVLSNVFVFIVGGSLTVLSYRAHNRLGKASLRYVTLGFALITASTIAEVVYVPALAGGETVTDPQLLTAYTIESLLIGCGLVCIYYGLKQN